MNCAELRGHYTLYALGLAEEPERGEIRAHLDRGCKVCVAEIARAREMTRTLGGSAPPAPPRRMPVSAVAGRRFGWAPFLAGATALSLAAAFYFSGRERQYFDEVRALRAQSRSQIIEITRFNEAFAILRGADTIVASFGGKQPKARGRVFMNPSRGMLLTASNLPPTPPGKAYELWFLRKGGKAVRAGMFHPESDGTAIDVEPGATDRKHTAAVAISIEVEAGVDAPTGTPLLVAPLAPTLQ